MLFSITTNFAFLTCCCEVGSWYIYGSFVPTAGARPFLMQREREGVYVLNTTWVGLGLTYGTCSLSDFFWGGGLH